MKTKTANRFWDAQVQVNAHRAIFHTLRREWPVDDAISVEFEMPILTRRAYPKVKVHRGKVAITGGPLVYCLEPVDYPNIDLFNRRVNANDSLGE